MSRRFRFRVRPGSVVSSSKGPSYSPGEELIVDEALAASMLRKARRSVDLIEVLEDRPPRPRKLP